MRNKFLGSAVLWLALASCSESEQKASPQDAQTKTTGEVVSVHKPSSAAEPAGNDAAVSVSDIARGYKTFPRMTPQGGVMVSWELVGLCRGVTPFDVKYAERTAGPHAYARIQVYMSASAADAFRQHKGAYPPGSVIIKEKALGSYQEDFASTGPRAKEGVGGMIKRAPGYDPDHGDWEYFYFEDPSKIEAGKISSCVTCHAGAAETDHVFGSWNFGFKR